MFFTKFNVGEKFIKQLQFVKIEHDILTINNKFAKANYQKVQDYFFKDYKDVFNDNTQGNTPSICKNIYEYYKTQFQVLQRIISHAKKMIKKNQHVKMNDFESKSTADLDSLINQVEKISEFGLYFSHDVKNIFDRGPEKIQKHHIELFVGKFINLIKLLQVIDQNAKKLSSDIKIIIDSIKEEIKQHEEYEQILIEMEAELKKL